MTISFIIVKLSADFARQRYYAKSFALLNSINMMLTKYRYIILALFVLVSMIFGSANKSFKEGMTNTDGLSFSESFGDKKIKSQFFSFPDHPLRNVLQKDWNNWFQHINQANLLPAYKRIFWIDNLWALLLILLLFAFGESCAGTKTSLFGFILVLVLAYLFDFVENLTYLKIWEGLYSKLPFISLLKLGGYLLGILWMVYNCFLSKD